MYALLGLYARPYNAQEPVVCVDEKSKQLLRQTRAPIPVQPGQCAHEDYEYKRAGTRNIFVAIEPKGKRRRVEVTARRTKVDFVAFVKNLWRRYMRQRSWFISYWTTSTRISGRLSWMYWVSQRQRRCWSASSSTTLPSTPVG